MHSRNWCCDLPLNFWELPHQNLFSTPSNRNPWPGDQCRMRTRQRSTVSTATQAASSSWWLEVPIRWGLICCSFVNIFRAYGFWLRLSFCWPLAYRRRQRCGTCATSRTNFTRSIVTQMNWCRYGNPLTNHCPHPPDDAHISARPMHSSASNRSSGPLSISLCSHLPLLTVVSRYGTWATLERNKLPKMPRTARRNFWWGGWVGDLMRELSWSPACLVVSLLAGSCYGKWILVIHVLPPPPTFLCEKC